MIPESYYLISDDLVPKIIPEKTMVIICGADKSQEHLCDTCSGSGKKFEDGITTIKVCFEDMMQKKYLRWDCGSDKGHEHKYRWIAWICGNWRLLFGGRNAR